MHMHTHGRSCTHEHTTTHRWTPPPAEPPNCPNCGVLGQDFNSEWVALQVLGISCLGVNVRQKDKAGHFTGHCLLLPADQQLCETLLCFCTSVGLLLMYKTLYWQWRAELRNSHTFSNVWNHFFFLEQKNLSEVDVQAVQLYKLVRCEK